MNCTSVVLWGSSLSSTLGLRFSDQLWKMVSLSPYINSIMVGLMLSDGSFKKASLTRTLDQD